MGRYIILLLLTCLCSCSDRLADSEKRARKVKFEHYKMPITYYDVNGYKDVDTLHKEIRVGRIVNQDTVTYIYERDKGELTDTLKIYKNIFLFNRERLKTYSEKKMSFKGKEITVYNFLYLDNRVLHATCSVPWVLYINDSVGVIMATRRRWHIVEYGIQTHELQKMIQKDSVFFQ